MKTIWMLAAAASLAACAGRGEDDMGAAPERDTTAVTTGADTSQFDTTNTGGVGQTGDTAGVVQPTTPTDTTIGQDPGMTPPADTSAMPADTTAMPGGYDTPVTPSDTSTPGAIDTTGTGMTPDTAGTTGMTQDTVGNTGTPSLDSAAVDTTQAQ
jgi:hypothetical protein